MKLRLFNVKNANYNHTFIAAESVTKAEETYIKNYPNGSEVIEVTFVNECVLVQETCN